MVDAGAVAFAEFVDVGVEGAGDLVPGQSAGERVFDDRVALVFDAAAEFSDERECGFVVVQSTMWRGLLSVTAVSLLAVRACSRAGRGFGSAVWVLRLEAVECTALLPRQPRRIGAGGGRFRRWRGGVAAVVVESWGEPERGLVQGSGQLPAGEAGAESGTERVQNLREQVGLRRTCIAMSWSSR
ncbi:hypothetical protein GS930_18850 [Rhodococcus hoagii]|nr:hypothetical protein [Prescottella equi]